MFPACLVSTVFVVQNAAFNGFGCGLGGPAGEHHEHQLGGSVGHWGVCGGQSSGRYSTAALKTAQHRPPNGPTDPPS